MEKAAKFYICNYFNENKKHKRYHNNELNIVRKQIKSADAFADKLYSRIIRTKNLNIDNIKMSIEKITELNYNEHDIDILEDVSKDEYKKYILQDADFTKLIFDVLKKNLPKDINEVQERMHNALIELKDEESSLQYRIDRLLKNVNKND